MLKPGTENIYWKDGHNILKIFRVESNRTLIGDMMYIK